MGDFDEKYWFLRMTGPTGNGAKEAWEQGILGVWHGNYSVADFREAQKSDRPSDYLTEINKRNGSRSNVSKRSVRTVRFFLDEIKERDWVLVHFDGALHLARLAPEAASDDTNRSRLNGYDGDRPKYRRIVEKKCFQLERLPNCFLRLRNVGRATLQPIRQVRGLVKILVDSKNEKEVEQDIKNMSLCQLLDTMGLGEERESTWYKKPQSGHYSGGDVYLYKLV